MSEVTRSSIARVGVDLAKNVIQVHAVDGNGRRVTVRSIRRDQFLAWCAQLAFEHWRELDEHLCWCDRQIGLHVRGSASAQRAAKLTGIGELGAWALSASVGDFKQFKSADQFGASLGLVPRQNSSGGRAVLGRITKRGDDYLRTLLIQGAKAAVMSAPKRDDPISHWLVQLTARVGWQKACVAMANKNARILWAVMTREQGFDPHHVSVKPTARSSTAQPAATAPPAAVACAA